MDRFCIECKKIWGRALPYALKITSLELAALDSKRVAEIFPLLISIASLAKCNFNEEAIVMFMTVGVL